MQLKLVTERERKRERERRGSCDEVNKLVLKRREEEQERVLISLNFPLFFIRKN